MSTGQVSAGYALGNAVSGVKIPYYNEPRKRLVKKKIMKQSLKQRFLNWLQDTDNEGPQAESLYVEADRFQSDGIRMQIYKASGGYVVETRGYDRKTDRNNSSMHVINDEQDLGDALGKIVMMEALKG